MRCFYKHYCQVVANSYWSAVATPTALAIFSASPAITLTNQDRFWGDDVFSWPLKPPAADELLSQMESEA